MHIHILGICGTFMGGLAVLARELGYQVSGSDANVYPPMSTQLAEQGIELFEGYDPAHLNPRPDLVVIGNALSRGNPAVEAVLAQNIPYNSGAQWLAEHVLRDRWVLAVAGTHGKTTTSSLLAWLLEDNQLAPGFLIGGIPANFGISARLGSTPFFVVEADEYDTAFFDKRSKFVHYHPRTLVLNNLEYDHADIFPDLDAIKTQFHHLLRTVPGNGLIISNGRDQNLDEVIERGCWTPLEYFAAADQQGWQARLISAAGDRFALQLNGETIGEVGWQMLGEHNVHNALAAIAAARHAGIPVANALQSLAGFKGVKRRMELRGVINNISVYDDFAHHPTAIATTLQGLRNSQTSGRILAVLEPRSNTMRLGVHKQQLPAALSSADNIWLYQPAEVNWDMASVVEALPQKGHLCHSTQRIIDELLAEAQPGDHIIIMSNGGFEGLHQRLLSALQEKYA